MLLAMSREVQGMATRLNKGFNDIVGSLHEDVRLGKVNQDALSVEVRRVRGEMRLLEDEMQDRLLALREIIAEREAEIAVLLAERTVGNSWHGQMIALTGALDAVLDRLGKTGFGVLTVGPTSTAGGAAVNVKAKPPAKKATPRKAAVAKPKKRTR
jgi:hypothetical protein